MSDNKKKNQLNIFKSVKSDAITELSPELLETGLDLITDSEVIKEIPLFGIGFKGYSLYKKITESFFTKKLLKFLIELKDIPLSERIEFIRQLESKKETSKAGEKLLITLNRLNDDDKATIIGRLFKHTILEGLNYSDFSRLTHIIDNAFIDDLKSLKKNPHLSYLSDDVKSNLHQLGLLTMSISDIERQKQFRLKVTGSEDGVQPDLIYKINGIGAKFVKFGFE